MCQECWDLLEKEAIKKKLPPVSYIRNKYQPSHVTRLLKHRKNSIERTYGISVVRVKELMKEQKISVQYASRLYLSKNVIMPSTTITQPERLEEFYAELVTSN